MNDLIERAKAWLEINTGIKWATEPYSGISVHDLNQRPDTRAKWLAEFAQAERERLATSLINLLDTYGTRKSMAADAIRKALMELGGDK